MEVLTFIFLSLLYAFFSFLALALIMTIVIAVGKRDYLSTFMAFVFSIVVFLTLHNILQAI